MTIHNNFETVIKTSIEKLLNDYKSSPLLYMREIGLQVRLRNLVQEGLLPGTCKVLISNNRKKTDKYYDAPENHEVERTQLELRIQTGKVDGKNEAQKTDIIILKASERVVLTVYPNGPLDIVSRILKEQVDAAIEVKAACSADKKQRHLFRKDIRKLWELTKASERKIAVHFVLIDKSISTLHKEYVINKGPEIWSVEDTLGDQYIKWTDPEKLAFWVASPKPIIKENAPEKDPYVTVWELSPDSLTVTRRYATFME